MTDERQSSLLFESWLKGTDPTPPDASRSVAEVMDRVPEVRQRGRWWPLPAFDRPVSTFPSRELAPAPIPATNGRTRPRGFTMFSAVRFVVASVIVALFGGFLLTSILTTPQDGEAPPAAVTESPSPMTSEELLSGMVTEEVEPGVFRVVNDGVRDLAYVGDPEDWEPGIDRFRVDVTPDGSVWLSGPGDRRSLFRLGEERVFEGRMGYPPFRKVAPDGSLWSIGEFAPDGSGVSIDGRGIFSFDGERWTVRATATDGLNAFAVGPDGTVWAVAEGEDKHCPVSGADACRGTVLLRLEDDGSLTTIEDWADVHDGDAFLLGLAVSPDGDVWLVGQGGETKDGTEFAGALLRFDGEGWEAIPGPEGWALGSSLASGPDGTLWVNASDDVNWGEHDSVHWLEGTLRGGPSGHVNRGDLARYDGAGWTTFTDADGVEPWGDVSGFWAYGMPPTVAADGSLWLQSNYYQDCRSDDDPECGGRCGGAAHYDGTTWTSYLEEYCIDDLAIAPDGSVWLGAHDGDTDGHDRSSLYVITPEAVAGTE